MLLCLVCSSEINPDDPRIVDHEDTNYGACPECGHRGIPADTDKRLNVSITWHELRCLVMWAERWASASTTSSDSMLKIVYGIADRIIAQHLDQDCGLTFRSELAGLSEAGFKFEQNVIREDEG